MQPVPVKLWMVCPTSFYTCVMRGIGCIEWVPSKGIIELKSLSEPDLIINFSSRFMSFFSRGSRPACRPRRDFFHLRCLFRMMQQHRTPKNIVCGSGVFHNYQKSWEMSHRHDSSVWCFKLYLYDMGDMEKKKPRNCSEAKKNERCAAAAAGPYAI